MEDLERPFIERKRQRVERAGLEVVQVIRASINHGHASKINGLVEIALFQVDPRGKPAKLRAIARVVEEASR